jgi:uncharacterized protein (TIGR03067 family)
VRTCALFAALSALSLGFAPAPFPKPDTSKDDLKKMQGSWHRLTCTGGSIPPAPRPINDTVVIKDNQITYNGPPAWTLTLGTLKDGRKSFDIKSGNGAWVGVYELNGDSLRVCFTSSPMRPSGIMPTLKGEYLQTFRRKKP